MRFLGQGEADLFGGVAVPRPVEVRFLAAEDVAVVLQELGLATHEQVIEGHRALRVTPFAAAGVARSESAIGRNSQLAADVNSNDN